MPNHPGRKPGSAHPDPELIRATRDGVLQTQTEAAATVHASMRTWQDWEAGKRRMPLAAWELYLLVHCLPGGMLRAREWRDWLRPELVAVADDLGITGRLTGPAGPQGVTMTDAERPDATN